MNGLIRAAIDHKRLVISILAMILIAGGWSYIAIPKEDMPDVQFPFYAINFSHEGISPEDAERMILKPMEKHLKTIKGLKEMKSTGFEGGASITLEFESDADPDRALFDVRTGVDMGRADLPEDTDEPVVSEFSASEQPIIAIVLYGTTPERTMVRIADDLKDRIEAIPSVLEAKISGKRDEVLEVIVDPTRLETYNVSLAELFSLVNNNNRLIAAGSLSTEDGRFAVKVPGLFESARDVASLPVKTSRDGVVTLGDLGDARLTFKDPTSLARFNGAPAITLEIVKRPATNTVETALAVKALTERLAESWPEGLRHEFTGDTSVYVADFLSTLQNSVLSAVALVTIVIVAALGWRSASLVGIAIPGSFLFGILILMATGLTINTVVLFGLILAVGLLVDGAIVVTEYADRKMLEGHSNRDAYRLAAQRMAWPIIASTATTLVAFMPLLFWPGILGDFMSYLPLTVIYTLAGSLLMALVFVPTLGGAFGRPGEADASTMEHLSGEEKFDPKALSGFTGGYVRLLGKVIRHPVKIALLTFLTLISVWTVFAVDNAGIELFPNGEPNSADLVVHARGNLSIQEMNRLVGGVEARLGGIDGVRDTRTRVGAGSGSAADSIGRVTLLFEDWDKRRPADEIEAEVRRRVAGLPGIRVELIEEQQGPVQGKAIQMRVTSDDAARIEPVVARLREHLDSMAGLVDIEDSRPVPGIEWRLAVDRAEAGRFGTDITSVGSFIQLVTNGALVGRFRPDATDDEVDIRVRFPESARGLAALDRLRVPTEFGMVPIRNFVRRVPQPKTGQIERIDSDRVLTLAADVLPGFQPNAKVAEIRGWMAGEDLDPRVRVYFAGQDEMEQESIAFLSKAFIVALFLMLLILLAQFNSFYQAGLVLTAIVLSTVGAVFGLWLTERPFMIVMSGVGIIALAGIVVNNNIVLIDTYDRLVKQGMAPRDAILQTGAQRLRPVMLTTVTTIIGLMPMVFQFNVDFIARAVEIGSPTSFIWVDLALAIAFGLAFSTVLTLVVTPALLALRISMREAIARLKIRLARRKATPGAKQSVADRLREAAE